jgi:hypothetical protein
MPPGDYTLLVDETGIDGQSERVMYVGCLFATPELSSIERSIQDFNQMCLDDPLYSAKPGLVNGVDEPRHFTDDSESLRVRFIDEVVRALSCRVYAVFDTPKATVKESKVKLFTKFIQYIQQVREIKTLNVIIEKSGVDDKDLEECGAKFKGKEYLPLGVADYYGAILHRFHEQRLKDVASGKPLKPRALNSLAYNHYSILVDRISLERDLSTGEKSSRREGRYFLDQIRGIVTAD